MRGFSLLEVLVATTIIITSVAGLVQLVALAAHTNRHARQITIAVALAQQKIEELLPDVATAATPSPPAALDSNVDGYSDFADAAGHLLGAGPAAPAGSEYLRRWSIDRLANGSRETWIVQVVVTDMRSRSVARFTAAKTGKGL